MIFIQAIISSINSPFDWLAFFGQVDAGLMLVLTLSLVSMGLVILYRNDLNKKEKKE